MPSTAQKMIPYLRNIFEAQAGLCEASRPEISTRRRNLIYRVGDGRKAPLSFKGEGCPPTYWFCLDIARDGCTNEPE